MLLFIFLTVAEGAAHYAELMHKREDMDFEVFANLHDVTPLSIGIRVTKGNMDKTIARNTKIPCKRIGYYRTSNDYQTEIEIKIYEGIF